MGVSLVVFSTDAPLAYLIFPPLIWAALRFWQPGAVATTLIVSGVAVAFANADVGPFSGDSPDVRLVLAQTFVAVAGITALLLAAVITERQRVEDIVEYIADTLQESLLPRGCRRSPACRRRSTSARPASGTWWGATSTTCSRPTGVLGGRGRGRVREGGPRGRRHGPGALQLPAAAAQERTPSRALEFLNDAIRRQRPSEFCSVAFARLELNGAEGAQAISRTPAIRCRSCCARRGPSSRSARMAPCSASPTIPT